MYLHKSNISKMVDRGKHTFGYTPVHLIESVENYALCMGRYLACCSNMSVTHSALAFTRANRTDARLQGQALNYAQLQATLSSTGRTFY